MITPADLSNSWDLVRALQRPVLIVTEPCGGHRVYICDGFKSKGRDFFQNEVTGGQEITELVSNDWLSLHNSNMVAVETRLGKLPKLDFNFGHDSFTLLKSIR